MDDQDKKTSNFLKAINKFAEEQKNKINDEAEKFKKKEIEKAETEILNDVYILIQKEIAEMKIEISKKISNEEKINRKKLFEKRNLITKNVFDKSREKLIRFSKNKEYIELLKKYSKAISHVLKEPGTVLYLKKEDMNFSDLVKEAYGNSCSIEEGKEIKIGGIYGYNPNKGLIADETLDSKLKEQYLWFEENSGLILK